MLKPTRIIITLIILFFGVANPTFAQSVSHDSYEPNNNCQQPTWIGLDTTQHHSLTAYDVDCFAFYLPQTSAVLLETVGLDEYDDTVMTLYDSSLTEIDFDDDSAVDLASQIHRSCVGEALPAGVYFVQVEGFNKAVPIDNYSFNVRHQPCPPPPSPQDAVWLSANGTHSSSIEAGGADLFAIRLPENAAIHLETFGSGFDDTSLTLFDGNLNIVGFDDDGGAEYYSYIGRGCEWSLNAGIYYIQVQEYSGHAIPEYYLSVVSRAC